MDDYGHKIPTAPKIPVIIKTKYDVFATDVWGDHNHYAECLALLDRGVEQGKKGARTFKARITRAEMSLLLDPKEWWPVGISPTVGARSEEFIASVKEDGKAQRWEHRDDGEYLQKKGKVFRLRSIRKYEGQGYHNLYAKLELFTDNGWKELESVYCGDTHYGAHTGRRQQYEQLRRQAEFLAKSAGKQRTKKLAIDKR